MNKVLLTGTVGQHNNEVRTFAGKNGQPVRVANFQLCVRYGYGEQAAYGYFNITKFNVSDKFKLEAGKHISVVGSLRMNYWKDKNGQAHYQTDVIADEIEFLPDFPKKKAENTTLDNNGQYYDFRPGQNAN